MRSADSSDRFLPRDFIETAEKLVFAVVAAGIEDGRVLAFLRYALRDGRYTKLATAEANRLLKSEYPDYLYYSKRRDADLHAVTLAKIAVHHQPCARLHGLLKAGPHDIIETKAKRLIDLFVGCGVDAGNLGLTGSLLIGAQTRNSDIDLVVYGRENFLKARAAIECLIDRGALDPLDETLWRDAYARRGCALEYPEFLWHEQRKFNKGAIQGTKFDIGLVDPIQSALIETARKLGPITLRAKVIDDSAAFDYPSRYRIEHDQCEEAVCFTPTYAGQARCGEIVEISGVLEQSEEDGRRRVVVGSSREAPGEYIKVITTTK